MKVNQCSETSAYKIQKPGNCPEETIQHTEHGESLKSRVIIIIIIILNTMKAFSIFFLLALQPPLGVVFYSPLAGFSILACEVS